MTDAQYLDAGNTVIAVVKDGQRLIVPVDPLNSDYQDLIRLGISGAPYAE